MSITSWTTLYEAFRAIGATSAEGFEGFVAQLFEAETGDRYYVAATGNQPSGDARDERGGISIQTKAYFVTERFRKDEAIAQLQRAIRSLPELDLYVLAATRDPAQLRDELEWAENEFGVDVLLLHLGEQLTELGALAVTHWNVVESLISDPNAESRAWAAEKSAEQEVHAAVASLRKRLRGIATQQAFHRRCDEFLRGRFASSETRHDAFNPIELRGAISRRKIQAELQAWWDDPAAENAVLIGEEGMGKTWTAAEFASAVSARQGGIVLWLDSAEWCAALSMLDVLDRALSLILLAGDRLFRSYHRKILHRWPGPLLIVLDGANESDAWRSAGAILNDYFAHHESLRGRIRLLFTTRPFSTQSSVVSDFWRNSRQFSVGPFSLEELDAALASFASEVAPSQLAPETRDFIRVPLYFRIFLRYRARLASLHHLDKRFLLWMEVQEKLADQLASDPHFTAIQKATEADLSAVLAELAQSLTWPAEGEPTVPMEEVRRCIPGFREVRADLQAKKIITSNDLDFARWSLDHAIVALALLLQREAERHAGEPLDRLHDRLRARLEPLPSTDEKVRAIHVAVLLSFISSPKSSAQSVRAALLTLWLPQRNADLRADELLFFVEEDFAAFIAAVEWSFRTLLRGDFETTLIKPLAQKWRERGAAFAALAGVLKRWLRLIFPGDETGSKNRDTPPPAEFPVAASEPQLRLSCAAISVISFRPEISLLPALLDCYRSHSFCYQDWGKSEEQHRYPVKNAYDHLGVLLRWHFDELELVEALATMASGVESGSSEWEKIHDFARNIRLSTLPAGLGEAEDVFIRSGDKELDSVDYLRAVLAGKEGRELNCLSFEGFARDAIRRDLPTLTDGEVEQLAKFAQEFFDSHQREVSFHNTLEQRVFVHLLPWLARYAPAVYHSLIADYACLGCTAQNPSDVFLELDRVAPVGPRGSEIIIAIFARMPALLDLETRGGFDLCMTEIVLLHGSLGEIVQWSEWLGGKPLPRGGCYVTLLPLPAAFADYAPAEYFETAKSRAAVALDTLRSNPCDEMHAHLAKHWLNLACYCAPQNRDSAEWAFATLGSLPANSELEWPLVYLLLKIPDLEMLRLALANERIRHFIQGEDGSFFALRLVRNPQVEEFDVREIDALPLSAAGLLYWRRDDEDGLRRWALRLRTAAFAFLETEPPTTRVAHRSYRTANSAGLIDGGGVQTPGGGEQRAHYRGSGAWGVDRESETHGPTQEEVDRLISEYHDDLDRLREWAGREVSGFNAGPALTRWADSVPAEFSTFADSFLNRLERAGVKTFEALGTLAWCVATAMVKTDPRRASDLADQWRHDWAFRVVTFGGLATIVTARIWSSDCNSAPDIASLRSDLCDRALSDEELFVQALAAIRGGTLPEIIAIAKERFASTRACERALGVTLLGFVTDDEASRLLKPISAEDPSFWVRNHAAWAQNAVALERGCQTRYAELLREPLPLVSLAAGLAELRPALTPLARGWRPKIEESVGWRYGNNRAATYLDIFWHHWECGSNSHENVNLAGRLLKEFCRGEKLKDGVTSKMAPWWT